MKAAVKHAQGAERAALQEKIEDLQDKMRRRRAVAVFRDRRPGEAQRDPPAGARRISEQGRPRGHAAAGRAAARRRAGTAGDHRQAARGTREVGGRRSRIR